jgi:hypothetical protein
MSGFFREANAFRGQADSEWGLHPSVLRPNVPYFLDEQRFPRDPWKYRAQVKLEIELLWLFISRANVAGLLIPGDSDHVRRIMDEIRFDHGWVNNAKNIEAWPPRELVPALALAQHHGVPTRLLDWTYAPYTAAYFAAESAARSGSMEGRFAVWQCSLTRARDRVADVDNVEIITPSGAFNANLHAQRGCLMLWRHSAQPDAVFPRAPLEVILSQEADRTRKSAARIFNKVTVPKREAGAVLQLLSRNQVDGSTLFPGYDGIARVVRERVYWTDFGLYEDSFTDELNRRTKELRARFDFGKTPLFGRLTPPDGD